MQLSFHCDLGVYSIFFEASDGSSLGQLALKQGTPYVPDETRADSSRILDGDHHDLTLYFAGVVPDEQAGYASKKARFVIR